MIRSCAALVFLAAATAAMAGEPTPSFSPSYVGIVTGETREFEIVLNRTYWWPQSVRNPSPEIVRVGSFSRSDWGNSGYIAWRFPLTGVTPGIVVLDLVMTNGYAVPIEWYAGSIGDLSGPVISRYLLLEFTPAEPKAYHFWYRIYDRCGVGSGEVIIDAGPLPRRHSVKR